MARDAKGFDLVQLSKITEGHTGFEIEACVVEALYAEFDRETAPTELTVVTIFTACMPPSKLIATQT
jgi:glutamine phosphoribosylpyrophosphate amidotransferase